MRGPIELAQLPAPQVVEELDFEAIYAERKAAFLALHPEAPVFDIEGVYLPDGRVMTLEGL